MKKYIFALIAFIVSITISVTGCKESSSVLPGKGDYVKTPKPNPADLRTEYPGADDCKKCHREAFLEWAYTGHAYMINKITEEAVPQLPFSDLSGMFPNTITNTGFSDSTMTTANTSYIIGGYYRKAQYLDSTGKVKHGTNAQYNLGSGTFVSYNNGTADAGYNCGFCHTTGWDESVANTELADATGSWAYSGVTCQRCHGTDLTGGLEHNTRINKANVYAPGKYPTADSAVAEFGALTDANNIVCADCHVRGDHAAEIETASGLLLYREQANELYAGQGHTDHSCITCHNPMSSTVYGDSVEEHGVKSELISNGDCTSTCHTDVTVSSTYANADHTHTCIDCHMPYIVKSAADYSAGDKMPNSTSAVGTPSGRRGDMRSHIFALTTDRNVSWAAGTITGVDNLEIPTNYSCMTCHNSSSVPGTASMAGNFAEDFPVHD